MKLTKIMAMTIIAITAILLTGCQEKQLKQCQLENTELQAKVETYKQALDKKEAAVQKSVKIITEILMENGELRRDIAALRKAQETQPKPKSQIKKPAQTPEQKAELQKGLQRLFQLQRESVEKMKKEREKMEKESPK